MFCVLVDWLMNGIYLERQHLGPNLVIFLLYGVVNLSVTKYEGYPVYPGLNWDTWWSVALALLAIPYAIGLWLLLWWCTNKKL